MLWNILAASSEGHEEKPKMAYQSLAASSKQQVLKGRARELLWLPHSDFLTRLDSCKNYRASSLIKDQSQTNRRAAVDVPSKPILLIQQAHWGGAGVWRHYDSGKRRNALGCPLFCSSMCFHPKSDRRSTCLILSVYNSARTYNRNSLLQAAGTELTLTRQEMSDRLRHILDYLIEWKGAGVITNAYLFNLPSNRNCSETLIYFPLMLQLTCGIPSWVLGATSSLVKFSRLWHMLCFCLPFSMYSVTI